jgi:hypothetical protein
MKMGKQIINPIITAIIDLVHGRAWIIPTRDRALAVEDLLSTGRVVGQAAGRAARRATNRATGTLTPCDALNMGLAWWLQEGFTIDTNSYPTWRVHACVLRILLTLATLPSGGRDQGRMSSLLLEYIVFERAQDIRGRPQRGRPPRGCPPRMLSSTPHMLLVGPRATGMWWTAFKISAFGAQGASWE